MSAAQPVWHSRRSPVLGTQGVVSCTQPLASQIGSKILDAGGNAADAAVAMAAAMNVTEPCSTGIGGDMFAIFYDAKQQRCFGVNGSGRSPAALSIDKLRALGVVSADDDEFPDPLSVHTVNVPGAAAGWCDTIERHGSGTLSLAELLRPAIELAERGFPVSQWAAYQWQAGRACLVKQPNGDEMLQPDGEAPREGELMKMPRLAATFRALAEHGRDGFYKGRVAQAIVDVSTQLGGTMTLDDLAAHRSTFETPITTEYEGVVVHELPPNGQGITVLIALNILRHVPWFAGADGVAVREHNSALYVHTVVEALKLAFADARYYVADTERHPVPVDELLSDEYAASRAALIDRERAREVRHGELATAKGSSTVYFSVVDKHGNACSFINSNFDGFGSGIVPKGCGFTLHNRGWGFRLTPGHPNALAGGKRAYHTIIPAMATAKDGALFACFGVMGAYNQPQGHVQVLLNMLHQRMDAQAAIDAPRFSIVGFAPERGTPVCCEPGIDDDVLDQLRKKGHNVERLVGWERRLFGKGQIIHRHPKTGVMWAGSDPRGDGIAIANAN